jgi:hypothetical protein
MAVHCSKCGEELLGAVNRCWKCGQMFALHPEMDGRPPVRAEAVVGGNEALNAIVVEPAVGNPMQPPEGGPAVASLATPTLAQPPMARVIQPRRASAAELIDARRAGMMAMGGTVTSLVLGVFAAGLAAIWPPAAMVAVLGLVMGIWGLSSPRRNWALVGMLLCCLAIGLGTFRLARNIYISIQANKALTIDSDAIPMEVEP